MKSKLLFIVLVTLGLSLYTNIAAGGTTFSNGIKATETRIVHANVANIAPTISFNTAASKYVDLVSGKISCVMNNSTDPFIVSGLDILIADEDLSTVVFSMTSSKTTVVPVSGFSITGTGSNRKFKIIPLGVGYTTITLKITDAQGLNSSVSLSVAVSAALDTASTKDIYHTGVADGSTSIPIDDNYMFIADDETNVIKLFSRNNSGLSVYQFDVTPYLNLGGTEVDMEASFRSVTNPNRIYWIGSLSNSKSGNARPDRNRIFATDIVGTGANATLVFVGYYDNLRAKLISWGDSNGYNFTAKAATGIEPKRIDGFNIEGLEMGPDGTSLYIGFRAPYVGTGNSKALICPLKNFETWFGNGSPAANPTFGSPIELDLGTRGIRSLGKNGANEYMIVAGRFDGTSDFKLYSWNGLSTTAPVLLSVDLKNLKPEGIVNIPTSISGSFSLDLVSDLGSNIMYNDAVESKDLTDANFKKFLTSTLEVTVPVVSGATLINVGTNGNPVSVTADKTQSPNSAANTLDKVNSSASKWSDNADGGILTYDFGGIYTLESIKIATTGTSTKYYFYGIQFSTDGLNYSAITNVTSNSDTTFKTFLFTNQARYVRIIGGGNSSTAYSTISEIEFYGTVYLSVKQNTLSNSILIYPVPATNNLTIESTTSTISKVEIYAIDGKKVLVKNIDNLTSYKLDLGHLVKGNYIVKVYGVDSAMFYSRQIIISY